VPASNSRARLESFREGPGEEFNLWKGNCASTHEEVTDYQVRESYLREASGKGGLKEGELLRRWGFSIPGKPFDPPLNSSIQSPTHDKTGHRKLNHLVLPGLIYVAIADRTLGPC